MNDPTVSRMVLYPIRIVEAIDPNRSATWPVPGRTVSGLIRECRDRRAVIERTFPSPWSIGRRRSLLCAEDALQRIRRQER